jgi:hypothetical protein
MKCVGQRFVPLVFASAHARAIKKPARGSQVFSPSLRSHSTPEAFAAKVFSEEKGSRFFEGEVRTDKS